MRELFSAVLGLSDTAWAMLLWGLVAVVIAVEVLR